MGDKHSIEVIEQKGFFKEDDSDFIEHWKQLFEQYQKLYPIPKPGNIIKWDGKIYEVDFSSLTAPLIKPFEDLDLQRSKNAFLAMLYSGPVKKLNWTDSNTVILSGDILDGTPMKVKKNGNK